MIRLTFIFLFFTINLFGQERIITGKIIDHNFYPIYQYKIFNADTLLLEVNNLKETFKIAISNNIKSLTIIAVAQESKKIYLNDSCGNLEIIFLTSGTYDFMSAAKVDRLRKKYFKMLPKLHQTAFEKGIFKSNKPCYIDKFIPIKKRLK